MTTDPTTPAAEEAKAIRFKIGPDDAVLATLWGTNQQAPTTAADLIAALQANDARTTNRTNDCQPKAP